MSDSPHMQEFLRNAYRRIQIALAFYVISETPSDQTSEQFVRDFQHKYKQDWFESRQSCLSTGSSWEVYLEELVLQQQQCNLMSRLNALLPKMESEFDDGNFSSDDDESGIRTPTNCTPDAACNFVKHIGFIEGLIQLKSLSNMSTAIPLHNYSKIVGKMNKPFLSIKSENSANQNSTSDQQDSGICSMEYAPTPISANQKPNVKSIKSNILHYIISSCDGDRLVLKSIRAILEHFRKLVLTSSLENINTLHNISAHWQGSIYQDAVTILKEVLDDTNVKIFQQNSIRPVLQSFIQDVLNQFKKNTKSKFSENQCELLLKVCSSPWLYSEAIDLIIGDLENILMEHYEQLDEKAHLLEQIAFLFYTLQNLTQRYIMLLRSGSEETAANDETPEWTLWRYYYEKSNLNKTNDAESKAENQWVEEFKKNFARWENSFQNIRIQLEETLPLTQTSVFEFLILSHELRSM